MTCKGCSASVRHTKAEVEALVKDQLALEIDVVSNSVYQERLSICERCPNLQYGTTCGYCGCFVAFRAKLAYKRCPDPSGAKWA
ncbi:hypothetical protein J2T56_000032 [Natronobacillus azotifigens]|uniref:DUF6171 family protein n=1 Tax=Natronobacillus azotifigens TaxID=472978 RepID=A0A9J6R7Y2_9BACI|nr:DUF6171 family protein [Natronobacillus azotifigens]MCZ0701754.1 DUF6171 family protein [Natronobacillus azotifigens]